MNYKDLNEDERLALAGLLQAMIRLDGEYTREESTRLRAIADELGEPDLFWAALERASMEISSPQDLAAATSKVARAESRGFVVDVLNALAAAGGLSTAEAKMIEEVEERFAKDEPGPYR